jgi:RNA polymerase sigma-70 factor (ECF subfamily)
MSTRSGSTELKRVYREVKQVAFKRGRVGIHDYEDIAQEAMIRYLNKGGGSFVPHRWIHLAVKCVTWDFCRKKYRQRKLIEEFGDEKRMNDAWTKAELNRAVCEPSVDEIIDRRFVEISLIALLGEGSFELLKLYADGFSYKEIAQKLNIKLGTVRSRIHYAKTKAKTLLET